MVTYVNAMVTNPVAREQVVRGDAHVELAGDLAARRSVRRGLTPTEFTAHAAAQVSRGQRQLIEHVTDRTGCCRSCGRPSPCPLASEGEELVRLFAPWLPDP